MALIIRIAARIAAALFVGTILQTAYGGSSHCDANNDCSPEIHMIKLRLFLEPPALRTSLSTYFEVDVPLTMDPVPAEALALLSEQFDSVCHGQSFLKGWSAERCSKELLSNIADHLPQNDEGEEDRIIEPYGLESSARPFVIRLISPISGVYYLNEQGEAISVDVQIESTDGKELPTESFFCYKLVHDGSGKTIEQKCETLAQLTKVPTFPMQLFQSPGQYTVGVDFVSPVFNTSDRASFFTRRKALQSKLFGSTMMPRQSSKVVALAIKYGTHGDDAKVSVAVGGRLLFEQSMWTLFRMDDETLRADLTSSQRGRSTLGDGSMHTLDPQEMERLSDHLALQAATGFADGCDGVFVTTAGVTWMCADQEKTRLRWAEAARRVVDATRMLLGLHDVVGVEPFVFDACIFTAAHQDTQDRPTSAFTHARAVFSVKAWGFEDDCESAGDPTLLWEQEEGQGPLGELNPQPPLMRSGITSGVSSTMRRLLRRMKSGGEHFIVSRPGLGWDTTLAHRWLASEGVGTFNSFELNLMEEHTGVIGHADPKAYFGKWNKAMLDSDVIAVFPGTQGRMRAYCDRGLRKPSPSLFPAAENAGKRRGKRRTDTVSSNADYFQGARRCETVDANQLSGTRQLTDPDTWWGELEGMRVLVIHPFAETIQRQYRGSTRASTSVFPVRYEGALFPLNPSALPHFRELHTYIPAAGRSKGDDWRESLRTMESELRTLANSFDVALLGCGGWGPLLQQFIRHDLNRSSIYLGGNLQLHFGILGGRFEMQEAVTALSNSAWTWPTKQENRALRKNLKGEYASYTGSSRLT